MKRVFKKLAICLITLCILSLCSGCEELGYEDEETYVNCFDDTVYTIYTGDKGISTHRSSYSMSEYFFNHGDLDNFSGDHVDAEYYAYLGVELDYDRDVKFDEVCLFMKPEDGMKGVVYVRMYIAESLPSSCLFFGMSREPGIKYADDYGSEPIGYTTIHLDDSKKDFSNFMLSNYTIDGKKQSKFTLKDGQCIILQFVNNTGYNKDIEGMELKPIKFTMCNLIINSFDLSN